jgi:hypothetical protein
VIGLQYGVTAEVVDRLDRMDDSRVLQWGCPVPYFGSILTARVATVGINPSNREFMDALGQELRGKDQRLPTLDSLGISTWADADSHHLRTILAACTLYFNRNPYDRWFQVLENILTGIRVSYYGAEASACHLDLVPYATLTKWGSLSPPERDRLIRESQDVLGLFLRDSRIEMLILNGQSVVDQFAKVAQIRLSQLSHGGWTLPRSSGSGIQGVAYAGMVDRLGGVDLGRSVTVVGYNHNLQSSFGVTGVAMIAIREWIALSWTARRQ